MTTHFTGPVVSEGGFQGDVQGDIVGGQTLPTATTYSGATGQKAISPADFNAHLTKATAGTDYTLAAPGAGNVGKILRITSDTAAAHVLTVTGLLGGTTLTFAAAIGNGCALLAVSATIWRLENSVGITQS